MDASPPAPPSEEKTETTTPPVGVSELISPVTTEPAAQQLASVEREMTGFEKATLRWAKVAVLMSGLAALFVCAQWREMHVSGIDTHALAQQAISQASAMQGQLAEMQKQNDFMRREMEATNAAFIQAGVGIDKDLSTVEVGASNGGHVDASNIHIHVVMTQRDALTGRMIGLPVTICDDLYKPKLTSSPGFDSGLNHKYYPADLPRDSQFVVQGKRWIEMRSDYRYENGFGKTISDTSCDAFLPVYPPNPNEPFRHVQCDEAVVHIREYQAAKAKRPS